MTNNYSKLEKKVLALFSVGSTFKFKQKTYKVLICGKPNSQSKGGEPKTDCYIQAIEQRKGEKIELKISCKLKKTNEFQENKISSKRAEELLGPKWEDVIVNTSTKIKNLFESHENLNNPEGFRRNKLGHVVLGWKLEVANKHRKLSAKLALSDKEIRDYIYKGINQEKEKKDAMVNGQIIKNSGVANYILVTETEDIKTSNDVISQMEDIDNHIINDHYLIFTSNAYRIQVNKTDGNRPLAVRVEWNADLQKQEITPTIKYDSPLKSPSTSNDMKKMVDIALSKLPGYKDKYKK